MDVLSAAHAKEIIHCDVKPGNIVCSPDGEIKNPFVIDWGLAIIIGEDTATGFRGTQGYASVSSLRGNG